MDDLDTRLIALLRRNARESLSNLATALGVTRATVRARMERLQSSGVIQGYTLRLERDMTHSPVRGLMLLGIEGRGTERLIHRITGMPEVQAVHTTNGKWDLIVEIATASLPELDSVLATIRKLDGVSTSETNLLLRTTDPR